MSMQFAWFTAIIDATTGIIVVIIIVAKRNWNLRRRIEEGGKTFRRVYNLTDLPLLFMILLMFQRSTPADYYATTAINYCSLIVVITIVLLFLTLSSSL